MDTKWTKGPLAVDPFRAWIVCPQLDDDGDPCPVAALAWPTKYRSEEETFANAQLYAAAPDLYEALKLVDEFLCGKDHNRRVVGAKVAAALTKARGETA